MGTDDLKTILIVEDDENINESIKKSIEDKSYIINSAFSIEQAYDIYNSNKKIDLIIADIYLPDGEIFDFLKKIKDEDSSTELIIISAMDVCKNIIKSLELSSICFIDKPFSKNLLIDAVELAFARRRTEEKIFLDTIGNNWYEFKVPSHIEYVRRLSDFLKKLSEKQVPKDIIEDVSVAFKEILANSVEWGNRGDLKRKVTISYLITENKIIIKINDEGKGFDWEFYCNNKYINDSTADPLATIDKRTKNGKRPGGWGITIAKNFIDSINFSKSGNSVILTKYF